MRIFKQLILAGAVLAPVSVQAQTWTTWGSGVCNTPSNMPSTGLWTGTDGSTTLTYTGACNGGELSNGTLVNGSPYGSVDYFTPTTIYTQGGLTSPDAGGNDGFIQFNLPYAGSLTFSSSVHNPLLAFISLGQPNLGVKLTFTEPGGGTPTFDVLSYDACPSMPDYFGACGSFSQTTNTLTGYEFAGTVELEGDFTEIDFTGAPGEFWYGFTVGINGPDQTPPTATTPEPATLSLMAMGLVGLAGMKRRRRKA